MSAFNGRRGPNVSQYLRELNTIPTHEADENFVMDDDLAMFTNTQFFDFDSGQNTDFNAPPAKPESADSRRSEDMASSSSVVDDFSQIDFISGDFNLGDFVSTYASPTIPNFSDALGNLQTVQTVYQPIVRQHQQPGFPHHQPPPSRSGDKRKSDALTSPTPSATERSGSVNFEDVSRVAAEEDKRRRNTAASARFRVKKKQREQALEKSAKEMSEKVSLLENRIQQLETENKWLKNLIMEKNDASSKEDIVKLWKDPNNGTSKSGKGGKAEVDATTKKADAKDE